MYVNVKMHVTVLLGLLVIRLEYKAFLCVAECKSSPHTHSMLDQKYSV